jgi:hypothetical protein
MTQRAPPPPAACGGVFVVGIVNRACVALQAVIRWKVVASKRSMAVNQSSVISERLLSLKKRAAAAAAAESPIPDSSSVSSPVPGDYLLLLKSSRDLHLSKPPAVEQASVTHRSVSSTELQQLQVQDSLQSSERIDSSSNVEQQQHTEKASVQAQPEQSVPLQQNKLDPGRGHDDIQLLEHDQHQVQQTSKKRLSAQAHPASRVAANGQSNHDAAGEAEAAVAAHRSLPSAGECVVCLHDYSGAAAHLSFQKGDIIVVSCRCSSALFGSDCISFFL